jgi:putative flippase GtrA
VDNFADAFRRGCARIGQLLPFGLDEVVPAQLIGFLLINTSTFAIDLALLTLLRSGLHWPVPVAITLAYGFAFGLAFVLQRWLNFPSRRAVGRQVVLYVLAIAGNYTIMILGVGAGLASLGVPLPVARIFAGAGEAVFMYCALRWVVFAAEPRRRA